MSEEVLASTADTVTAPEDTAGLETEGSDSQGSPGKGLKINFGGAGLKAVGYFASKKKNIKERAKAEKLEAFKLKLKTKAYATAIDWKKIFAKFDKEQDGNLDLDSFRQVIRKAELFKDEDVKVLFDFVDANDDGRVSQEEFETWLASEPPKHMQVVKKRDLTAVNARKGVMDDKERRQREVKRERKRVIQAEKAETLETAKKALVAASYAKGGINWQKVFRKYDEDNTGEINFEDFRAALRKEAKVTDKMLDEKHLHILFDCVDKDKGGSINYATEFLSFVGLLYATGQSDEDPPEKVVSVQSSSEIAFSMQIGELCSLVKKQSKTIQRMQADHKEGLTRVQQEQDALCNLLQSSGTLNGRQLQAELARSGYVQPSPVSPGSEESTPMQTWSASQSPMSPSSGGGSPFAFDPEDEDLFEICQPLLKKTARRGAEYDKAIATFHQALASGRKPDVWRGPGTPLLGAVEAGNAELSMLLLQAKASVNVRSEQGVSPLHVASYQGAMDTCIMLLDFHADPSMPDCYEQTPMFFSPIRQICELLLQRLADPSTLNCMGQSAMHLAAKAGYCDVLLWFVYCLPRAVIELKDRDGFTAERIARDAGVSPAVLKKMVLWEPAIVAKHYENIKKHQSTTDIEMDELDDGDNVPCLDMQNHMRLKIRTAAYYRGGIDWENLFRQYDKTGGGELNYREFFDAIRVGANVTPGMLSDSGLRGLFRVMDSDGGGTVDYLNEFIPWLEPKDDMEEREALEEEAAEKEKKANKSLMLRPAMVTVVKRRLRAAAYSNGCLDYAALFKFCDRDNSGFIQYHEFVSTMRKVVKLAPKDVSDECMQVLFDYLDASGDGKMEYGSEFMDWLDPRREGASGERLREKVFKCQERHTEQEKAQIDASISKAKQTLLANASIHGQVNLRRLWKTYDTKSLDVLRFEDFLTMLRRNAKVKPATLSDKLIKSIYKGLELDDEKMLKYSGFLTWLGIEDGFDQNRTRSQIESREASDKYLSGTKAASKEAAGRDCLKKMQNIKEMLKSAANDHGALNIRAMYRFQSAENGDMDEAGFRALLRKKGKMTAAFLSDEAVRFLFEYVGHEIETERNGKDYIISYETDFLTWLGVESGQDAGLTDKQKAQKKKVAERKKNRSREAAEEEMENQLSSVFVKLKIAAYDATTKRANWEKLFGFVDKQASGFMNIAAFKSMIRKNAKVTSAELSDLAVEVLFDSFEPDEDGNVDWNEVLVPYFQEMEQEAIDSGPATSGKRAARDDEERARQLGAGAVKLKTTQLEFGGTASTRNNKMVDVRKNITPIGQS